MGLTWSASLTPPRARGVSGVTLSTGQIRKLRLREVKALPKDTLGQNLASAQPVRPFLSSLGTPLPATLFRGTQWVLREDERD